MQDRPVRFNVRANASAWTAARNGRVLHSGAVTNAPDSSGSGRWVSVETAARGTTLHLSGDWKLASVMLIERALRAVPAPSSDRERAGRCAHRNSTRPER